MTQFSESTVTVALGSFVAATHPNANGTASNFVMVGLVYFGATAYQTKHNTDL